MTYSICLPLSFKFDHIISIIPFQDCHCYCWKVEIYWPKSQKWLHFTAHNSSLMLRWWCENEVAMWQSFDLRWWCSTTAFWLMIIILQWVVVVHKTKLQCRDDAVFSTTSFLPLSSSTPFFPWQKIDLYNQILTKHFY